MGTFVVLMLVAAARGLAAGHARAFLAADVYHYLLVAPALYVAGRRMRPEMIPSLLEGLVLLSALAAVPAIAIIRAAPDTDLIWLVGAPLDEGGIRIKPDFAYPLVPMLVATTCLLTRLRARVLTSTVLIAAALVLTYKRTFWGSYAASATLAVGLALSATWPRVRRVVIGATAVALTLGLGLAVAVLAGLNGRSAAERGEGLSHPSDVHTVQTRAAELDDVLAYVRAAPLGYGLGAAPEIPFGDPEGIPTHYTHTIYLQWCLQGGVPAAIAGTLLLGTIAWRLVRRRREPAAIALAVSVVALMIAGFALQSLNSPISALVVGLGASFATARPGAAPAEAPD